MYTTYTHIAYSQLLKRGSMMRARRCGSPEPVPSPSWPDRSCPRPRSTWPAPRKPLRASAGAREPVWVGTSGIAPTRREGSQPQAPRQRSGRGGSQAASANLSVGVNRRWQLPSVVQLGGALQNRVDLSLAAPAPARLARPRCVREEGQESAPKPKPKSAHFPPEPEV